MSLPDPVPGLVIRFRFLWKEEQTAGLVEGAKDRPCAIVLAQRHEDGAVRTVVVPVTHAVPVDPDESLEIPAGIARTLGLDDGRHFVRLDQVNAFVWPGFDLRPVPGAADGWSYGMIPPGVFREIQNRMRALGEKRRTLRVVIRDDRRQT